MNKRAEATALTLVEVVIVLAVLVFLFIIFLSVQQKRTPDSRLACGTNLSGIGKAMLLYSNDYHDEFPRAGGASSKWSGHTPDWQAGDRRAAYGLGADGTGGQVSIGASLYLLVKYMEVTPRSFLCRSDKKVQEFKLESYRLRSAGSTLADLWDFGPDPSKHCSYAYQMLYGMPKLTVSSDPAFVVAADRNPWMDEDRAKSFSKFRPDIEPFKGTTKQAHFGNTVAHDGEGQNVMFLDTHVNFEKRATCGLENDNIYTSWDGADKIRGKPPKFGSQPADAKDSLLVNDPPIPQK